ncbi:OprD family porin [Pseudomonas profundi]|uniref:OprD family porin n=1 Tax=Pseudomonas TaxID=286 RepID=UPI0013A7ABFD|nr:OprD family porin [Pseudomonas sp. OIL-1]
MNRRFARWVQGLSLSCLPSVACAAAPDGARGFVEDSSWNLLNRSVYDRRDYRHGGLNGAARNAFKPRSERNDLAEEWGYGLMGSFSSGFTQGTVGLGLDAHAYLGVKLDSGGGRAGKARLLSVDNQGHPEDNYGRAGAAVKLRLSSTVLTYGEQRVKTPVFGSSDSRLLPETATGWLVSGHEWDDLTLHGGHFSESTDRNASSHNHGFVVNYSNGRQGNSFDFVGGSYDGLEGTKLTLYSALYDETWRQHYLGAVYARPIDDKQALSFNLNFYHTQDTGEARSGRIDNTTWSLTSTYSYSAHSFSLGYQRVHGDTPFDYVTRGAIYLTNAVALSDFNAPNEASWQVRYDLAMAGYGFPGLSFSAAYIRGSGIDGSKMDPSGGYAYLGYGRNGQHWERDLEARYKVQAGVARGLSLSARYAVHRGNTDQAELDADQLRFAVEYPI